MYKFTSKSMLATGVSFLVVFISVFIFDDIASSANLATLVAGDTLTKETKNKTYLSTSAIPVQVSGVVEAADQVVIYAETAGPITELITREGAIVKGGDLLGRQSTPVVSAQLELAAAERQLVNLQQSQGVLLAAGAEQQAKTVAAAAAKTAALRSVAHDNRVLEGKQSLINTLDSNLIVMTETVGFVNDNRSLFSGDGLEIYQEIISALYGKVPNHLKGGVAMPATDQAGILAEFSAAKTSVEVDELQSIIKSVGQQLGSLEQLLALAEADIYERKSVYVTSDKKSEFEQYRRQVLGAVQVLEFQTATFQQIVDQVRAEAVGIASEAVVTDVGQELAAVQVGYSAQIATQTDVVARAGESVALAQQSLGTITAPFDGLVSEVHVEVGEYVLPGTALFTLVGDGAREVEVTIPSYLLPAVAEGQPFLIDDKQVGHIDRFSKVADGGSGVVVVSLSGEQQFQVGISIKGSLLMEGAADVYSVSRSFLHFDTDGPYLQFESGQSSRIDIVYDAGGEVYVSVTLIDPTALVSANSISL